MGESRGRGGSAPAGVAQPKAPKKKLAKAAIDPAKSIVWGPGTLWLPPRPRPAPALAVSHLRATVMHCAAHAMKRLVQPLLTGPAAVVLDAAVRHLGDGRATL